MRSLLTKLSVWFYLWQLKPWYGYERVPVKLLYAQAYHETGGFESPIFKENKNIFGMKLPRKRKTYAKGENRGHATYNSVKDSIRDYFLRQSNFGIVDVADADNYMIQTVNSNYAEDPNYYAKWMALYNKIKGLSPNGFLLIGLFFWDFS